MCVCVCVYRYIYILSSSSYTDSMEFLGSLAIYPFHASLQAGPLDGLQCLHRTDIYVSAGSQNWCGHE